MNDNQETANQPLAEPEIDKPALVSHLSHELRTLLGGIIGINELLLASNLTAHQKQLAQTVDQSSRTLLSVLNDIVDLSRLEIGRMNLDFAPTDVRKIAHEVIELHSVAEDKQINLTFATADAFLVISDPARVKQLLCVMVGRMLAGIEKGSVALTIAMEKQSDSAIQLLFTASAEHVIGPEAAYLSTLNMPSQSGFNDSRWLSLFLVRKISQLMGGGCGAEQKGEVSSIWISLPARMVQAPG